LLATNLIIIILILGSKIVTKENTRIIKPCHCCWCFWLTCLHLAGTCWLRLSTSVLSKPLLTNPLHNVTIKISEQIATDFVWVQRKCRNIDNHCYYPCF
jgi:hypothetical protein